MCTSRPSLPRSAPAAVRNSSLSFQSLKRPFFSQPTKTRAFKTSVILTRRVNNDATCKGDLFVRSEYTPSPWSIGTAGRVVLTISNVNQVQDDTWDFKIYGVTICTYDGGGQTTLSFSADLPYGLALDLTATDTANNNEGNYFLVTVSVDGVVVLYSDTVNGNAGDTVDVGTFNT